MLANILSASLQGVCAEAVFVEVNTGEAGVPDIVLVGLPDTSVKESEDRVSSALGNSGFRMPRLRTTINLAPGHLRKEGPLYDLPIALGILVATGQLEAPDLGDYLIAGELGLSGLTRPIRGALALARLAKKLGRKGLIIPVSSAPEAALVEEVSVYGVENLVQAQRFLKGELELKPQSARRENANTPSESEYGDFSEVKGQAALRRSVEVAVSGGHNLIVAGSPGSGKSMVAKRIPTIMPAPSNEEFLEILSIQSAAGRTLNGEIRWGTRPFRAPHHTVSDIALLGGGAVPAPGEISLAHHGVLFLDELPEFKRSALEVLRQPLEDRVVVVSRSAGKASFPCSFMLVAALNPCPCGYLGDRSRECRCTPVQIQRYRARISGPLLDRIDIQVEAPALSIAELRNENPGESSAAIRARTQRAREVQAKRFEGTQTRTNAEMSHAQIRRHCLLDTRLGDLLQQAMERLKLSARAHDRILKVARTIADLADSEKIEAPHLLEAIQYRNMDRQAGV